jgi:hypothetical protein
LFIASIQIAGIMPRPKGHRHGSSRHVKQDTEVKDENKPTASPAPITTPTGNAQARKAAKKKVKKSFKQVSSSKSVLKI